MVQAVEADQVDQLGGRDEAGRFGNDGREENFGVAAIHCTQEPD